MIRDPLGAVKSTFVEEVNRVLGELGSTARFSPIQVSRVRKDYASYGLPVGFKVARELNLDPERAAETVLGKIEMSKIAYSSNAYAESGYLNLRVDKARFFRDVLKLASSEELGRGERKGVVGMVEHTSANPVHPLHVGKREERCHRRLLLEDTRLLGMGCEEALLSQRLQLTSSYLSCWEI
jgi:arginyl-tRNA synthetase